MSHTNCCVITTGCDRVFLTSALLSVSPRAHTRSPHQMKQSLEKLHHGIRLPEVQQDPADDPAEADTRTEA